MPATAATDDLGPGHPQASVRTQLDVLSHRRLVEARPTGPGIELGIGAEQVCSAARAAVRAVLLDVPILPGECRLRAVVPQDVVLLRCQTLTPLLVREVSFALILGVGGHNS